MVLHTVEDLKLFFDAQYPLCVRKASRILNNTSQAEDIVQECMIKLWETRHKLGDQSVVGYFHTMVRNRCIDHIRKKKLHIVNWEESSASTHPNDSMEFEELQQKIHRLIDSLPERCRQVFVLSRFEEMSYKEIADQLDISKKTVENQISKALKVISAGLLSILFIFFFLS